MRLFKMDIYSQMYHNVYRYASEGDTLNLNNELDLVRRYLDECGMSMPKQLYPYDRNDTSTWRYLPRPECSHRNSINGRGLTMLNKNWKYQQKFEENNRA